MIVKKDINWFLEEPTRLMKKKPFTRGGSYNIQEGNQVSITSTTDATFSQIELNEISQDTYIQEYDPSLHKIRFNNSIPRIAVRVGNDTISIDDMTIQAAYEKNIHAAHVLHLAIMPMEFTLCNPKKKRTLLDKMIDKVVGNDDDISTKFQEFKQEWLIRGMESIKYDAISKQKKVADVGLLYTYDPTKGKFYCKTFSYDDGYNIIPNYNEFGEQIACTLYYKTEDNIEVLDTYDNTYHYRTYRTQNNGEKGEWVRERNKHGFTRIPLLYKRGKVAWEYAISTIEMWELMANINAVALKRFGTFGLVLTGELDGESFKRDASTLIINLSADTSYGKQDAKVLEFPEPKRMLEYLEFLKTEISTFASVSFITPKDISSTGSGGNGIFLAMKNDLALATQSVADWSAFTNDMVALFQEGLSLETGYQYNDLKISAKLKPWSMESETTRITNLAMESKWLSKQTIVENSPHAAPDELDRIEREGGIIGTTNEDSEKAQRIARNNSSEITLETNKQLNE